MTTLFTIAKACHEHGHGASDKYHRICRMGGWENGQFPPLFETRFAAESFRLKQRCPEEFQVVTMQTEKTPGS